MATETSTQTAEVGSVKWHLQTLLETAGVCGLAGTILIQYALAVLVLNEVLAPAFTGMPTWFIVAVNSAVSVPVFTTMIVVGTWLVSLWRDEDMQWAYAIIYSGGVATLGSPIITWLFVAGVI